MGVKTRVKRFSRCICADEERKSILKILDDSQSQISVAEVKTGRKVPSRLLMKIARDLVIMKQNITGDLSLEEDFIFANPTYWDYARIHNRAINRCRSNIHRLLEYSPELKDYFIKLFEKAREERHHGQNYVGVHCTDQMRLGICNPPYI